MSAPGFAAESSLYRTMRYWTVGAQAPEAKNSNVHAQTICPPWDPLCTPVCFPYCTPCLRGEQACRDSACQWQKVGCCSTPTCCYNNCHGVPPCDCYCQCVNSIGIFAPPNNALCFGGPNDDPNCDSNCTCACYLRGQGCSIVP